MPAITLPFDFNLNVSVQAGDTAYYVPTTTTADFNVNSIIPFDDLLILFITFSKNSIVEVEIANNEPSVSSGPKAKNIATSPSPLLDTNLIGFAV